MKGPALHDFLVVQNGGTYFKASKLEMFFGEFLRIIY